MAKDVVQELTKGLRALHLPTMRSQYEALAQQATAQSWGYAEYLLELVQQECQQRGHKHTGQSQKQEQHP